MFDNKLVSLHLEFVVDTLTGNGPLRHKTFPFIRFTEDKYFQILLAHIVTDADQIFSHAPLKIQKNYYSISAESESRDTNIKIDAFWEREIRSLSHFLGKGSHTASGNPWSILNSKWQQPFNPITFCKKRKICFHPICTSCFSFLTNCRNDDLLAQKGLPTYSKSTTRFIYCPTCTNVSERNSPLYTFLPSDAETEKGIRSCSDLYRDFAKIITRAKEEDSAQSGESLAERFPCLSCEHVGQCYPAPDSLDTSSQTETHLIPLTFYDSYIVPLDMFHFRFDDFCHILSGLHLEEIGTRNGLSSHSTGQYVITKLIRPHLQPSCSFLFEDDEGGLRALEIFKLKMALFHQLSSNVREIYARCHHPHLDLRPANVWIEILSESTVLPLLWNFKTRILNLGSALPFVPDSREEEFFSGIYHPPKTYEQMFTSPIMQNRSFGHQEHAGFILQDVSEVTSPGVKGHYVIDGSIESRLASPDEISQKDVIHILIPHDLVPLDFWCKKIDQEGNRVYIRSQPTPVRKEDVAKLRSLKEFLIEVQLCVYPAYHVPCDLYSLGMMLFVALLVNDSVDLHSVKQFIETVSSQMKLYSVNHPLASEQEFVHYLHDLLGAEEKKRITSKDNIFLKPEERKNKANDIPLYLWYSALSIGFKLVTHIPNFSFCHNYGDFELENPEKKIDCLLEMVSELNAQIHTELFGSHKRNAEILEVLSEFMQENKGAREKEYQL